MSDSIYPTNVRQVTKYLREMSGDKEVELVRGKGYLYFTGGKANNFAEQGVYACRLNEMTLYQWLQVYNQKVAEAK